MTSHSIQLISWQMHRRPQRWQRRQVIFCLRGRQHRNDGIVNFVSPKKVVDLFAANHWRDHGDVRTHSIELLQLNFDDQRRAKVTMHDSNNGQSLSAISSSIQCRSRMSSLTVCKTMQHLFGCSESTRRSNSTAVSSFCSSPSAIRSSHCNCNTNAATSTVELRGNTDCRQWRSRPTNRQGDWYRVITEISDGASLTW